MQCQRKKEHSSWANISHRLKRVQLRTQIRLKRERSLINILNFNNKRSQNIPEGILCKIWLPFQKSKTKVNQKPKYYFKDYQLTTLKMFSNFFKIMAKFL